jgi:hypothetical protein
LAAWASTHISSSGGGGYIHPQHGGTVSAPNVTSTVTQHERTTLWINDGENDENITLDYAFPITNGHGARLIWGAAESADSGDYLYLKNNTTGQYHAYKSADEMFDWAIKNRLVPSSRAGRVFLYGVCLTVLAYMLGALFKWSRPQFAELFGWLCALTVIVPFVISKMYKKSKGREVCDYVFPVINHNH